MLELLFYEPAGDAPTPLMDVEAALAAEIGVVLESIPGAPYRPGLWRDAATGAGAVIDLGEPPIEEDPLHPVSTYEGWLPLHLGLQIPVTGPHWQCVEALRLVERLLERLPQSQVLDTEDTARGEETPGPKPWRRPRVLASWERLHTAHYTGVIPVRRMARLTSVCLWRFRRERVEGQAAHPHLHWPEALVLLDTSNGAVRSACFWDDPARPLALPPVDLVVIRRGGDAGVLTTEELLRIAPAQALDRAGAVVMEPGEALRRLHAEAPLLSAARFKALDDADWTD